MLTCKFSLVRQIIYIGLDYMIVTMKIIKKTLVTIELDERDLIIFEKELNELENPTKPYQKQKTRHTKDMLRAILSEE